MYMCTTSIKNHIQIPETLPVLHQNHPMLDFLVSLSPEHPSYADLSLHVMGMTLYRA